MNYHESLISGLLGLLAGVERIRNRSQVVCRSGGSSNQPYAALLNLAVLDTASSISHSIVLFTQHRPFHTASSFLHLQSAVHMTKYSTPRRGVAIAIIRSSHLILPSQTIPFHTSIPTLTLHLPFNVIHPWRHRWDARSPEDDSHHVERPHSFALQLQLKPDVLHTLSPTVAPVSSLLKTAATPGSLSKVRSN